MYVCTYIYVYIHVCIRVNPARTPAQEMCSDIFILFQDPVLAAKELKETCGVVKLVVLTPFFFGI